MNYTSLPSYSIKKRDKHQQLKSTATDIIKLIIIFLVVIIIGCISAGN